MAPERVGDMDNKSKLIVYRQEDGDIIVGVLQKDLGEFKNASVEFCTIGAGGGQSPATFEALLKLIEAMEEDNERGRFATVPTVGKE